MYGDFYFAGIDRLSRCSRQETGHDWELIYSDFLSYETEQKYDAIVIMGVIEHLPQYGAWFES